MTPATAAKNRARVKAWAAANPERKRASNAKWAKANPDKKRAAAAAWQRANRAWRRAYRATARAQGKGAPVPLTASERQRVVDMHAEALRLAALTGVQHEVDHRVPLAAGGAHHPDNMQVLTKSENARKGRRFNLASLAVRAG